jgi:hypothetical protein
MPASHDFQNDDDYKMLYAEQDGPCSAAQIRIFEDTWRGKQ